MDGKLDLLTHWPATMDQFGFHSMQPVIRQRSAFYVQPSRESIARVRSDIIMRNLFPSAFKCCIEL